VWRIGTLGLEGDSGQLARERRGSEIACDGAEELGRILRNLLRRRHQTEVGVDARGALVVIARAQMNVASQSVGSAPDDEADFGVGLIAPNTVDDMGSCLVERGSVLDRRAISGG
jgi:hypothetical protein